MPFRDITGHARLLRLLASAVARDTLPPSLIFAGPEGVGKRTTAVALAQAVNCGAPVGFRGSDGEPGPAGNDACGTCATCKRIARGVHSDVLLIAPGENGSMVIEQVRDVIERTAYRPFEGARRVVILDPADALVEAAQHALLKTLEEPPSASMFVLVTARPDALLPTVRSRCPRLRFGPLSAADTAQVLERAHGLSGAEARTAAAAAFGSPGRALEEHSGELADARGAAERLLRGVAATTDPRQRLESAKALAAGKGSGGRSDRDEVALKLQALASLLRDLGILSTRADARLIVNADLERELEALAGAFGGDRAVRAFSAVDRALSALDRNASPKVVADWLALQL